MELLHKKALSENSNKANDRFSANSKDLLKIIFSFASTCYKIYDFLKQVKELTKNNPDMGNALYPKSLVNPLNPIINYHKIHIELLGKILWSVLKREKIGHQISQLSASIKQLLKDTDDFIIYIKKVPTTFLGEDKQNLAIIFLYPLLRQNQDYVKNFNEALWIYKTVIDESIVQLQKIIDAYDENHNLIFNKANDIEKSITDNFEPENSVEKALKNDYINMVYLLQIEILTSLDKKRGEISTLLQNLTIRRQTLANVNGIE